MKTAIVSAKIDPKIKIGVQKAAREWGVSVSFLIDQSLRKVHEDHKRGAGFLELIPNKKTAKILKQAMEDSKTGKNIVGPFHTVEDFIKSLNQ